MAAVARPRLAPTPARLPRPSLLVVAQGLAIALFLTLVVLRFLVAPLDRYDEGVVLTKAMLLLAGKVPFRDYWATYGPLDTMMLAGAFKVFGVSVVVERLMGALTVVAFGAIALRLLTVIGLRGGMRLLLTGLIAMVPVAVPAFNTAFLANLFGLLAVLGFLQGSRRPAIRWPLLGGAMLGLASFARPEYAAAVGIGLLAGYGVLAWRSPAGGLRSLAIFVASGALVATVLWLPTVLIAGIRPVWLDLVIYSVQLYPKARSIPFGQGPEGAIVILFSLAFGAVWSWAIARAVRQRRDTVELARIVGLLLAGMAVFTWVRTRADGIHAFDAWPLTALLLAVLLQSRPRARGGALEAAAGMAGILLLSAGAGGLAFRDWIQPHDNANLARTGIAGQRAWLPTAQLATLLQSIDASVPPGEPIWVGLQRNDLITFNDTMLYFLSNHPPGTVYYEALPGLTNTQAVEQTITCQLSSNHVRLLILGPNAAGEPWNLSAVPGSTYLDRWIAQQAIGRSSIGPYQLVRLMPGRPGGAGCPS
jgi:hypothetical protein